MPRSAVALAAFVAFGCTTVRAPASTLGNTLGSASGAIAEPQLELWVESGGSPTPEELEQARALAQAALGAALAGREISPDALGAADPLLLVRSRAVARTDSRRSDQRAATVGVVVGFVVIVAAVVVIAVLSRDAPRTVPRTAGARPATPSPPQRVSIPARPRPAPGGVASAVARAPRPVPAPRSFPAIPAPGVRPAPGPRPSPGPPTTFRPVPSPVEPAPWFSRGRTWDGPSLWLGFEFLYVLPPPCCEISPDGYPPVPPDAREWYGYAPPPEDAPEPYGYAPTPPEDAEPTGEEPGPAGEPEPMVQLEVPSPPELRVESRGFFAGDETVLEVDLFDHRTGALLWTRVVRDDVDPRNEGDVTKLLDRALADQPWARRAASAR